jgi:dynein heavy chain
VRYVVILTLSLYFSPSLPPECPHNPWRIQNSALFARLELFMERVGSLIDFTRTLISFNKLAKVRAREGGKEGGKDVENVFDSSL